MLKILPTKNEKVVRQLKKRNKIVYCQQLIKNMSDKPKKSKLCLKILSATHRTKSKSRLLLNGVTMLERDFIQLKFNKWYKSR